MPERVRPVLVYWIWFAELKEISLLQKHRLLKCLHDPEELYHMSDGALARMEVTESQRNALQNKNLRPAEQILKRCARKGIGVLPLVDSAYPPKLRNIEDAPLVLYYSGVLPMWDEVPFIGVVGTRKASAYGLQVAHQMGSQIASAGGFIVSGGATGGDTAAMHGALDAGFPVVGVLGGGVDVVYPKSNRRLFATVVENGCLLSEYPPGEAPMPWHFLERNRIISGISNGVLIVEAPKKSGALNTARHALEQGRDVFVVPGNINTESCAGSNALLQEGAIPVLSGWDVLGEYEFLYPGKLKKQKSTPLYSGEHPVAKVAQKPMIPQKTDAEYGDFEKKPIDNQTISTYSVLNNDYPVLNDIEQSVLAQLTHQPQEPAELIEKLNMPSGRVLSALTMLTVKGLVLKHPGGRISRK